MIWGIDHLVMSVPSHAIVQAELEELGFAADFIDMDVPSAPEKTPILSQPRPLHDIGFFRPNSAGLAIETIAHGKDLDNTPGPYAPIFNASTGSSGTTDHIVSEALGYTAVETTWGNGRAFFCQSSDTPSTLNTLVLETPDVKSEAAFWISALGFRMVSEADDWCLLETSTPVAAWSGRLILKQSDTVSTGPMDSQGFTCLALVSNDIDNDLTTAYEHGGTSYDCRFEVSVNTRPLIVALFRTPNGALVEFIQNVK